MKLLKLYVAALAIASFGVAAKADIVVNPDFAPANGGVGYGAVAGWTQYPYPSTLGGFTYLTGSNSFGQPFWDNGTAGSATTVGFIQVYPGSSTDAYYQDLTGLVAGKGYYFSYLENSRSTSAPDVSVTIGGNTLVASHLDPAVGGTNPFRLETGFFVATGSTERLQFNVAQVSGGDDATALITNVSVVPTPEPSSLALLGTGLVGAVGIVRRKLNRA